MTNTYKSVSPACEITFILSNMQLTTHIHTVQYIQYRGADPAHSAISLQLVLSVFLGVCVRVCAQEVEVHFMFFPVWFSLYVQPSWENIRDRLSVYDFKAQT